MKTITKQYTRLLQSASAPLHLAHVAAAGSDFHVELLSNQGGPSSLGTHTRTSKVTITSSTPHQLPPSQQQQALVGNLPYSVRDNEIAEVFSQCGVEDVFLVKDRNTGDPKVRKGLRLAFLLFSSVYCRLSSSSLFLFLCFSVVTGVVLLSML